MGWKDLEGAWQEYANVLGQVVRLQEEAAQLKKELWGLREELQQHKERTDRLVAAAEKRLDRAEGIR